MKKVLVTLLTLVIVAGCSPSKRLARLLERHPVPEKRDTIYVQGETIYRDTTIYRYLPGESVVKEVYINVPVNIPDTSLILQTQFATALAHLKSNKLGLELIQHDTVFKFLLEKAIKERGPDTVIITKDKIVTVEKEIKPSSFWKHGFYVLGGLFVLSLFFFFLLRRR